MNRFANRFLQSVVPGGFCLFAFVVGDTVTSAQQGGVERKPQVRVTQGVKVNDPDSKVGDEARRVSIQETFQSAFLIEPLVQRLSGRSGNTLGFKFKVESANKETRIEVQPVGLRQELSGRVVVDQTKTVSSGLLRMFSPETMTILPGGTSFIEGAVQIPKGDEEFHTLGLLIRETGQAADMKPTLDANGNLQTKAGLQFSTQYLLRIDMVVEGVRGDQASKVVIGDVSLSPFRGRPQLSLVATNPTGSSIEYELRGRLRRSANDRSFQQLRLGMPVRSEMETDEKFVGRLLPKSQVQMIGLLPEAVASGDYEVDIDMLVGGRSVQKRTFAVRVNADDFPAQDVIISQAAEGVLVAPTQIELAQTRGGNRRVSISLTNSTKTTKKIDLSAVDRSGQVLTAVSVQPAQVTLPPGGNRKLSVTMRGTTEPSVPVEYGSLRIVTESEDRDYSQSKELPLAVIYRNLSATEVAVDPVVWDDGDRQPRFRVSVRNDGETHFPVDARLTITGSTGYRDLLHGGFGKWLLPGESMWVNFPIDKPLPPGDYVLRLEMQTANQPISTTQTFQVSDLVSSTR